MCMGATADFMWKRNPANGPVRKFFAIDEDTFGRSAIFVGDKADKIAVILIHSAQSRRKGRFAAIASFLQLELP